MATVPGSATACEQLRTDAAQPTYNLPLVILSSTRMNTSLTQRFENPASDRSAKRGEPRESYWGRLHALLLFLLGACLFLTNRWFTEVDDECAIIDRAAQPLFETVRLYLHGNGEHEHPPLYDLILHGWIRLTHGEQHLLRLPGIIFYVAGAWVLANAVKRRAGNTAGNYTLLLIALWPYGFHFGRLATWYSFCFCLVAVVTWIYFEYLERPTFGRWCGLVVSSVLLLYSNYFAWAILGCLGINFIVHNWKMPLKKWAGLALTALALLAAFIPIARPFLAETHGRLQPSGPLMNRFLTGVYDLYSVFVSESVAPWFWSLGVPLGAAIVASVLIAYLSVPRQTRRFLLYFFGLLGIMSFLGIANTKRILFISPWLLFPLGIALAEDASPSRRRILAASLLFVAAAGWYGIFSRNLYAAPHWVEPWEKIAQDAASAARDGAIVIGNNPSFFFYLTYDLDPDGSGEAANFAGLLPDSTRRANVYSAPQWLESGRRVAPKMIVVKGPFQIPSAPMDEAEQWLSERCMVQSKRQMVHDPGAEWKERFAAERGRVPWRIEIVTYACR